MNEQKEFVIGIDLHGTLLDDAWKIQPKLQKPLIEAIQNVKPFAEVVTCTGNDLGFVRKYLPGSIFEEFDGHVLETGCTFSNGSTETLLISDQEKRMIDELRQALEKEKIDKVLYFARRLATISIFTMHEGKGTHPKKIMEPVAELIRKLGFEDKVMQTRSNVAVDIIPKGHNKATGIKKHAENKTIPKTIGIADSLNDYALIAEADYGFMPSNASAELIEQLKTKGKKIIKVSKSNTAGVIEILHFIEKNLQKS